MTLYEHDIQNCLRILQLGGTILYPTDTVWGIGCDATNDEAIEKVFKIKNRNENKALIVLLDDVEKLHHYVKNVDDELIKFLQFTNKPTTVIYKYKHGLSEKLLSKKNKVAIRICENEFCKELIKRFGKPIVSTSANISDQPTPLTFNEISEAIKNNVDYVVSSFQDDDEIKSPSSIVKWKKGKIKIIRP